MLKVFDNPAALAKGLADTFISHVQQAIEDRGRFYVALAGGTTPSAAYQLLAAAPLRDCVNWANVFVYFGDERCVPPDDPQSNYKMAHEAFLDAVHIPVENVYRMHGEDDPTAAAADYARILQANLGEQLRFDLVILGLGPDGHTASLFPGTDPLHDDDLLVRAPFVAQFNTYRLTLTPRILNAARYVVFATEGAAKATALAAVLEGPRNPTEYPAQIIAPADGQLTWLVDRNAAAKLEEPS
ncbi:MAG: 6-phosphogluconolactonase [Candidatus Eremiobacteraeota bacterium]|nr:6-phosphogluconolactonase [Candidatus Eremiobacteraeota bacterium]